MGDVFTFTLDVSRLNARMDSLRAIVTDRARVSEVLDAAGHLMVFSRLPQRFTNSGPGWPPPRMRSGKPLMDTGALRAAFAYAFRPSDMKVVIAPQGPAKVYAAMQHFGVPSVVWDGTPKKAQWLMIPLSPPLSISEARTKKPRDFADAFFLFKGPEGPGLYRQAKNQRRRTARELKTSKRISTTHVHLIGKEALYIEKIFAAVKSVTIPARPYAYWSEEDIDEAARLTMDEIYDQFRRVA